MPASTPGNGNHSVLVATKYAGIRNEVPAVHWFLSGFIADDSLNSGPERDDFTRGGLIEFTFGDV